MGVNPEVEKRFFEVSADNQQTSSPSLNITDLRLCIWKKAKTLFCDLFGISLSTCVI